MVELKNVSFQYAGASFYSAENIDLRIEKGEFVVLAGRSGCGKTTVTRIINGLAVKFYEGNTSGHIFINGIDNEKQSLADIGRQVGSVFQDPKSQFFASITEDEVAFACENYGMAPEEIKVRIKRSLQDVNGLMLSGKEIYPMSSGEKQKIAIASVEAEGPEIFVFDEPSANLDMYSVLMLHDLLKNLKAKGKTVIIAEHRLYYLTDLADRFIYMEDGRVAHEFHVDDLLDIPYEKRKKLGLRAVSYDQMVPQITDDIEKKGIDKNDLFISVQDFSFSYGKKEIFKNLSFEASSGDIIGIAGNNGAGKTTLLSVLCGLLNENKGKVLYNGKRLSKRARKRQTYFVMQDTYCQLFGENLVNELRLGTKLCKEEAEEILRDYGLLELADRHPMTLSGGQKQRLTLAVARASGRDVLLLDEPTSGLDLQNMLKVSECIKHMAQEGMLILLITHDLEFALSTCNRILHLQKDRSTIFPLKNNEKKLKDILEKKDTVAYEYFKDIEKI